MRDDIRALYDLDGPYRGECFLCGPGSDARHRVIDSIAERVRAGETVESTAYDYGKPIYIVQQIIARYTACEQIQ